MKWTKMLVVVLVMPFALSGCELLDSLTSTPVQPQPAAIYAVEVVEANMHDCDTTNQYCDTTRILGPPDETAPWSGHFVSLGGDAQISTSMKWVSYKVAAMSPSASTSALIRPRGSKWLLKSRTPKTPFMHQSTLAMGLQTGLIAMSSLKIEPARVGALLRDRTSTP